MDSSPLINVFGQILFQNINRKLSEKNRILQTETIGEITCKMDDVPTNDLITLEPEVLNSYILNNEVYDISTDTQLKIDFNNDNFERCSQNKINEVYNNVIFKNYSDIEVDHQKKRITYKLIAGFSTNYVPPEFFYLNIKIKIKANTLENKQTKIKPNGIDNEQLDADSYCILEDSTDYNNVKFKCFSYLDSEVDNVNSIEDMTSNYIRIPKNSTDSDNKNIGYSYFRKKKKSLSAGAIVGIVLGSIAALALIIGIILFMKNSAKATVYPTQSINMSANSAMVPTESNVPVDLSKKNLKF